MGFFSPDPKSPVILMGWRYVAFEQNAQHVFFRIEPMASGPDLVYVPSELSWKESAPSWAQKRYSEILSLMKAIKWNRNLDWRVSDNSDAIWSAPTPVPGSLESTPGGQKLESERFFHPPGKMSHEQAHMLWHRLAERFAQAATGKVTLYIESVVENSVFQVVELPALKANPSVELVFK
jgi:hypothetical protein